jgi:hypothetical protein
MISSVPMSLQMYPNVGSPISDGLEGIFSYVANRLQEPYHLLANPKKNSTTFITNLRPSFLNCFPMFACKVPLPANCIVSHHDNDESKSIIVQVELAVVQRWIQAKPVPFCSSPAAGIIQRRSDVSACHWLQGKAAGKHGLQCLACKYIANPCKCSPQSISGMFLNGSTR